MFPRRLQVRTTFPLFSLSHPTAMDAERATESPGEREHDIVPELPAGPAMAAAALGEAFHRHSRVSVQESPVDERYPKRRRASLSSAEPTSSLGEMYPKRRRGSTASHVPIDHFDPEGVNELKRTITQQSAARSMVSIERAKSRVDPAPALTTPHSSAQSTTGSTAVSETGAPPGEKEFNFESHMRAVMKQ